MLRKCALSARPSRTCSQVRAPFPAAHTRPPQHSHPRLPCPAHTPHATTTHARQRTITEPRTHPLASSLRARGIAPCKSDSHRGCVVGCVCARVRACVRVGWCGERQIPRATPRSCATHSGRCPHPPLLNAGRCMTSTQAHEKRRGECLTGRSTPPTNSCSRQKPGSVSQPTLRKRQSVTHREQTKVRLCPWG